MAAQAQEPATFSVIHQSAGQQSGGRIVLANTVIGAKRVAQEFTFTVTYETQDHTLGNFESSLKGDAFAATLRNFKMDSVPKGKPAAIGGRDLNGLPNGHGANVVFIGEPPDLRAEGIKQGEFFINRQEF